MFETVEQRKARIEQQHKDDADYLRECLTRTSKTVGLLSPNLWYASEDTLLSVANILEDEAYLVTAADAIRFFEKPYHFESDMQEIIDTYEGE